VGFSEDLSFIFTDLASVGCVYTATITPADGSDTYTIDTVRTSTLSAQQLRDSGWADAYRLSIYIIPSDKTIQIGDIVTMSAEGDLRVLGVSTSPAIHYTRLDLGNKYSGASL